MHVYRPRTVTALTMNVTAALVTTGACQVSKTTPSLPPVTLTFAFYQVFCWLSPSTVHFIASPRSKVRSKTKMYSCMHCSVSGW